MRREVIPQSKMPVVNSGFGRFFENENQALVAMASTLIKRSAMASKLGMSYGEKRDLYTALGYPTTLTYSHYEARYERQDVASRIVEAPSKESWRKKPDISEVEEEETKFEEEWKRLVKKRNVFHFLSRVDKISGIGEFGILLMGFDDGNPLNEECTRANELLYLQPYTQKSVDIATWEDDPQSERFGLPRTYKITIARNGIQGKSSTGVSKEVHHSRILHIAEGLIESNVFGTPRLKRVYNRLQDLELIAGGSAEMFWRGAFPGYGFNIDKDAQLVDTSSLQNEIEEYVMGLKRYMRLQGIDIQNLSMQVADPSNHVEILVSMISASTGIPKRILTGSERGELASSQDSESWATRIDERRKDFCEPVILRPFVDRLISLQVLPEPTSEDYEVIWPEIIESSEKEIAETNRTRIQTLREYSSSPGGNAVIPVNMFRKKYLGWTDDEILQADEMLETEFEEEEEDFKNQQRVEGEEEEEEE